MTAIKESPIFIGWLVLCLMCAGIGGWQLFRLGHAAAREQSLLARDAVELAQLTVDEQARLANGHDDHSMEADLASAQARLTETRNAFAQRANAVVGEPRLAQPIDAYFAIDAAVERMRALAVRQHVALRPAERFGFAAFSREGPDAPSVSLVERQLRVVEHVIGLLLASGPRELLSIQRERPADFSGTTRSRTSASANKAKGAAGADYFVPDSRLVVKVPDLIDALMVRVQFRGQTPALRRFLTQVAASELPLIVRSIEVEPEGTIEATAAASLRSGANVTLVASTTSVFSVVVEFPAPSMRKPHAPAK